MLVNIYGAKTNRSLLLDKAVAGEEVIIARAGKPLARCRLNRFCCHANCGKSTAIRLTACCTHKPNTWAIGC